MDVGDEGAGGGRTVCYGALWVVGSSCPAAVLLGSPSVWLAANHSAGKRCHFSSVCQSEEGARREERKQQRADLQIRPHRFYKKKIKNMKEQK